MFRSELVCWFKCWLHVVDNNRHYGNATHTTNDAVIRIAHPLFQHISNRRKIKCSFKIQTRPNETDKMENHTQTYMIIMRLMSSLKIAFLTSISKQSQINQNNRLESFKFVHMRNKVYYYLSHIGVISSDHNFIVKFDLHLKNGNEHSLRFSLQMNQHLATHTHTRKNTKFDLFYVN